MSYRVTDSSKCGNVSNHFC